jgi:hypothetical protein
MFVKAADQLVFACLVSGAFAGVLPSLAAACSALAAELQQAVQQQQPQGMRGGFFTNCPPPGSRNQQQFSKTEQGLGLATALLGLWNCVMTCPRTNSAVRTFHNTALQGTILPAVKVLLAVLRARSMLPVHAALSSRTSSSSSSSSNSSGSSSGSSMLNINMLGGARLAASNDAEEFLPHNGVSCELQAVQVLTGCLLNGAHSHPALLQQPATAKLLAAPELQQLLLIAAAWLSDTLYKQKQGQAAVDAVGVLRALSNSSAAATHTGTSRRGLARTRSSSSSSSSRLEPRHCKVLELLGIRSSDPSRPAGASNTALHEQLSNGQVLEDLDGSLEGVCIAAELCIECSNAPSRRRVAAAVDDSAAGASAMTSQRGSNSSSSSSSSGGDAMWQQLAPSVARMLVNVALLNPAPKAACAAMSLLVTVYNRDPSLWGQPSAAAAVCDMAVLLGPALLHIVLQQQDPRDQQKGQRALWCWSVVMLSLLGSGGLR